MPPDELRLTSIPASRSELEIPSTGTVCNSTSVSASWSAIRVAFAGSAKRLSMTLKARLEIVPDPLEMITRGDGKSASAMALWNAASRAPFAAPPGSGNMRTTSGHRTGALRWRVGTHRSTFQIRRSTGREAQHMPHLPCRVADGCDPEVCQRFVTKHRLRSVPVVSSL